MYDLANEKLLQVVQILLFSPAVPVVPIATTTPSAEDISHFPSATTTIEYSYPIVPFPSTTTNPSPVASQTAEDKTAHSPSGPYITVPPPIGDTRTALPQAVFFGIAAASLLGIAGILSVVCLGCVCIRRQRRKASPANEPEEQGIYFNSGVIYNNFVTYFLENEYVEMMRSHIYSSNILPGKGNQGI